MARTKTTIDAVGWRAVGTDYYSVEVAIMGALTKKDKKTLAELFEGWRLVAEAWNPTIKKTNEFCTYKREFDDVKDYKAYGRSFPWPFYDKNTKTGNQKLLNKRKVKHILEEREQLEEKE